MAIQFSGLASGLDTDNIIKELIKAEQLKVDKVTKEKTKLEWKKDVWEDMNKKLYEFYTKHVYSLKSKGTFLQKKASVSNDAITVNPTVNATNGVHQFTINKIAKGAYLNSNEIGELNLDVKLASACKFKLFDGTTEKEIELEADCTIEQFAQKINDAGLNIKANFDRSNKRIFFNSLKTGEGSHIVFKEIDTAAGDEKNFFDAIGLVPDGTGIISAGDVKDATDTVIIPKTGTYGESGQDAEYTYNSVALTSATNQFTINGLEVSLNSEHAGNIDVNIIQDTDEMFNKVKEFITEYNKLLVDINEKLGADAVRGYEPLTTEEKKAMSEDEVKLWEDKIKKSLLRRDTTLNSLLGSIRGIVGSSSGVDTTDFTYNYLSDLGIVTGDYKEKGVLHINGDEDDPLYAAKTNTLKEAIESDPDKVSELLNAIGDKLYSTMQEKMKSTTLSSALTFFNDKLMDDQVKDYKDRIADLEERLAATEQRYYKQFTAMEQAIQAMNNQSASLASMLGGGA